MAKDEKDEAMKISSSFFMFKTSKHLIEFLLRENQNVFVKKNVPASALFALLFTFACQPNDTICSFVSSGLVVLQ